MSDITYRVCIDFDYTGGTPDFSTPADDITAYVQQVDILGGIDSGSGGNNSFVAGVGICDLLLDNSDLRFSPASTEYGANLRPGKPVRVQVIRDSAPHTVFLGYTRRLSAESGPAPRAIIHCQDRLALLQDAQINLPLQENIAADALVTHVVNAALRVPVASAAITVTANPADSDTVTVNGTIYTFKSSLGASPNQVLIGTRREDTAANLVACLNGASGAGTTYTTGSTRPPGVTAATTPELPDRATLWHADSTVITGNALTFTAATAMRYGGVWQQSTAANGDMFTHALWLQRGTYTLNILGRSGTNRGLVDWLIDGVTVVSAQDWYAASTINNVIKTATVTIPDDGYHVLTGVITGKNASSSGYILSLVKLWLVGS